ncbi:F-box domain protein [Talaromyces proteolyticus]|uniref:F-box domain protein n=1 Tax=Talaromyces proteolyticus TaxID=1131652 RepID=A0AAD4KZD6_9EURO|nr:F-box domain protein [Talaromyces proteolyticus]KAH8700620.1 F-box domain protein [Talaromyces proteolyticus]
MASSQPGDIAYLPQELFQMILCYLEPVDIIRCRRVCSAWYQAFSNPVSLVPILKRIFPLAREICELSQIGPASCLETYPEETLCKWRLILDRVSERYYRLAHGRPRSAKKYNLQGTEHEKGGCRLFEVFPWENHASHFWDTMDMFFEHAFWTYEKGLLVFPNKDEGGLTLLDLETENTFMIPFVTAQKVIRRIRLQDRLLVVEWAEYEAFHWLNDRDKVHRHYATSFDIVQVGHGWDITLRNEWKIMFLGHPLGDRDRFYSTHSSSHYAIYVWQPNRSLYTAEEDAPIESLSIWNISQPSNYRASLDPTGRLKETVDDSGPSLITRFSFRELGFYSVRQGGLPGIIRLDIDSNTSSISITEAQNHDFMLTELGNPLEYTPSVLVTTIPFAGQGPSWRRKVDTFYPPYRGNCAMEIPPWTITAPWPCYWGICEATDKKSRVSFCLSYLFSQNYKDEMQTSRLMVTIHALGSITRLSEKLSDELSAKGKICGDERFLVGENEYNQLTVLRF